MESAAFLGATFDIPTDRRTFARAFEYHLIPITEFDSAIR